MQLVIADFFQMPPVTKLTTPGTPTDAFLNFGYAFQAPAWRRSKLEHVLLTRVYRQKDAEFLSLLDAVRAGRQGKKAIRRLVELCGRPLDVTSGIKPTQIFSRNKDVDDMNTQELAKLPGPPSAGAKQYSTCRGTSSKGLRLLPVLANLCLDQAGVTCLKQVGVKVIVGGDADTHDCGAQWALHDPQQAAMLVDNWPAREPVICVCSDGHCARHGAGQ